jgi:hypothetical protein
MIDETPKGDFTVITEPTRNDALQGLIETLRKASGSRHNAIATVHREAVQALARLYVPRLSVSPSPDQFRDLADFLNHWARIADRVLKIVGEEAASATSEKIDAKVFEDRFFGGIDGDATFELERCAEAVEAEQEYGGYDDGADDYYYEKRLED